MLGKLKIILRRLRLLPAVKLAIAAILNILQRSKLTSKIASSLRTTVEKATFSEEEIIHDLPQIAKYWDDTVLHPRCEAFGFRGSEHFYEMYIRLTLEKSGAKNGYRIISIGSGNGDLEICIAQRLLSAGVKDFLIECLDFNPAMMRRLKANARSAGVDDFVVPRLGDFNAWIAESRYDVVMANYSLHHVVQLEHLFINIKKALLPHGRFLTADMIGRNGHSRWPETLELVEQYWAQLTEKKKYNHATHRIEHHYVNRDSSAWGFEGIRAQDILPILVKEFHFDLFIAWGGLIDPFLDRSFGHNYDPSDEDDRKFITELSRRNDEELISGRIKPTQMYAVMALGGGNDTVFWKNLTPEMSVRATDVV
jgi:SAM-dependent methyltransferase